MRMWFNGKTDASQASVAGSIPVIRSKIPQISSDICGIFLYRKGIEQPVAGPALEFSRT